MSITALNESKFVAVCEEYDAKYVGVGATASEAIGDLKNSDWGGEDKDIFVFEVGRVGVLSYAVEWSVK